jgi:hypothetical protein
MNKFLPETTFRASFMLVASTIFITCTTPALAMTGAQAVRACEAKTGCKWNEDSQGHIMLEVDGHLISCAGLSGQCVALTKTTRKRSPLNPRAFFLDSNNQGSRNNTEGRNSSHSSTRGGSGGGGGGAGGGGDTSGGGSSGGGDTGGGGNGCAGGIC